MKLLFLLLFPSYVFSQHEFNWQQDCTTIANQYEIVFTGVPTNFSGQQYYLQLNYSNQFGSQPTRFYDVTSSPFFFLIFMASGNVSNVIVSDPFGNTTNIGNLQYTKCVVLPIKLDYFNVEKLNGSEVCTWQTAIEQGSAYFQLQGSADGLKWDSLYQMPAEGNSSTPITYTAVLSGHQLKMESSMGLLWIALAALTLLTVFKRFRRWPFLILLLCFYSCTKSVPRDQKITIDGVKQIRLKEVNIDGTFYISKTVIL